MTRNSLVQMLRGYAPSSDLARPCVPSKRGIATHKNASNQSFGTWEPGDTQPVLSW
jgi:hypothetical protein